MMYAVQPILIWPASMAAIPGYRAACDRTFEAVQCWYREKAGRTFTLKSTFEIRVPWDQFYFADMYQFCRRSPMAPSNPCDPERIFYFVIPEPPPGAAVGGGTYDPNVWGCPPGLPGRSCISGGMAHLLLGGDIAAMGYPLVDWAREQRQAIGAVAHEIGHCVGLPHPEDMTDPTIMFGWWDFPAVGFQQAEREIVRASPFFSRRRGRHW